MSKNLKKARSLIDFKKTYLIEEALELAKKASFEKFDTTFRLALSLNLDPKHADQNIRGSIVLPSGTGKTKKVLAVVDGDNADKAKKAGADHIGGEEILEKIKNDNWFDFDVIVTTPTLMPKFAKYGKLLGTKGLMPNPKLGTVTSRVDVAIENIKKGSVEYKVDSGGVVNLIFGKKSFNTNDLVQNYNEILNTIKSVRPNSVKGDYIKTIFISTTMGPGLKIAFEK